MPPVSYGLIESTPAAIARLVKRLSKGSSMRFCYEAGPCGYEVHRQITQLGHRCDVVAPSLIPRKARDRVKTDRRDALSLARLVVGVGEDGQNPFHRRLSLVQSRVEIQTGRPSAIARAEPLDNRPRGEPRSALPRQATLTRGNSAYRQPGPFHGK